jgi:hypothetical protein
MVLYTVEEFRTKVVPEAIIRHRVSIAVKEVTSEADRQVSEITSETVSNVRDTASEVDRQVSEITSEMDRKVS